MSQELPAPAGAPAETTVATSGRYRDAIAGKGRSPHVAASSGEGKAAICPEESSAGMWTGPGARRAYARRSTNECTLWAPMRSFLRRPPIRLEG